MRNYTENELREVLGQEMEVSEQVEQRLGDVYNQIRTGRVKRRRRRTGLYTAAGTAAAVFAAGVFCVSNPAIAAKLPVIGHIFEDIGETAPYPGNFSEVATVLTEEDGTAVGDAAGADGSGAGDGVQEDGSAAVNSAQGDRSTAADGVQMADVDGTQSSATQTADRQDSGTGASGVQTADGQDSGTGASGIQAADGQDSGTADSEVQAADADGTQGSATQAADAKYTQTSDGLTVTLSEVYCNDLSLYLTMQVQSEEPMTELAVYEGEASLFLTGDVQLDFMEKSVPGLAGGNVYGKLIDENTFIGIYRLDLAEATTDYSAYDAELERLEAEGADVMTDANQEKLNALLTRTGLPEQFHVQFTFDQIVGEKAAPLSIHDVLGLENPTEEDLMAMSDEEWHAYMQDLYAKVPDYNDYPNQYHHIWFDGPFTFDLDVTVDRERTKVVQVDGDSADDGSVHVKSVTLTPFELSADVVYPVGEDGILQAVDAQGKRLSNGTHGGSTDMYAIDGHDMSKVDLYYLPWDAFEQSVKGLKGDYFDTHETNEDGKTLKDLLEENSTYHREIVFEE